MKTKSKNSDKLGYVYFILNPKTNAVKIGYTTRKVEKRKRELQTSCDTELVLLYTVKCGKEYESYLHRYFQADKLSGEWHKSDRVLEWIRLDRITKEIMIQENII